MGLLVLGFGIATMAKFVLLFFGVVTAIMLYQKKILKLRHIAIIALILIVAMLIQHSVREKMERDAGVWKCGTKREREKNEKEF